MGLFGPPNIEKMKAKRKIRGLIRALGDHNHFFVAKDAAIALGELKDARAVKSLITALRNTKYWSEETRRYVAWALGEICDARAVNPLIDVIKDKDEKLVESARWALKEIGLPAVGPLIAAFENNDSGIYWDIGRVLEAIGVPAVDPLVEALNNKDRNIRLRAVGILGQIKDTRAVEPLIALLKDADDEDIRERVIWALGELRDTRSTSHLVGFLANENEDIRQKAAEALWKIKDASSIDPLLAALKNGTVRLSSADAVIAMSVPSALEVIINALKDRNDGIRQEAVYALEKLGWKPENNEASALYWVIKRNWEKCIEIGTSAVGPLLKELNAGNRPIRYGVAETLVALYRDGRLDDAHKRLILDQRDVIQAHQDSHRDSALDNEYGDWDSERFSPPPYHNDHTDTGIGVDFPL